MCLEVDLLVCARVCFEVGHPNMRTVDMRIELRSRYIGMTKQLLNNTEVGSPFEHMGRKAMAQGMRMQAFDPCYAPVFFYYGVNRLT